MDIIDKVIFIYSTTIISCINLHNTFLSMCKIVMNFLFFINFNKYVFVIFC